MKVSPKDPEFRAKVIKLRKEGKKWDEIAKLVGVSLNAVHQYHKRKWFIEGMSAEKGKDILKKIEEKNDKKKETPAVKTPSKDKEKEKPQDVVGKTKEKAQKEIDKEVEEHIQTSDKKPPGTPQKKKEDKTSTTDKTTPKSKSKGGGVWFLLAIVLAVAVIGIVFLILRPKPEERAEYNKPTGKKEFDGRPFDY